MARVTIAKKDGKPVAASISNTKIGVRPKGTRRGLCPNRDAASQIVAANCRRR